MENIGAAVGIDLGSQNSVIAAVMRRGIDIILNQSSTRSSPTLVGYTKEERLAGIPASNQIKANFKNTIQYPSRFLGVPPNSPQAQIQSSFISNKLASAQNKIIFNVQHQGQALQLFPQQIVGCYLQKLRQFLLIKNIQSKDVVITVPSYFTAIQRQCMLDACEIAGLNCQKLINESSAITYAYGLFRKDDFTSKSRFVVFVDLGHAKCTVTISSFTKDKGKIVAQFSERNLGARNFDAKLMNVLCDKFNSQYGCDPRSSPKCKLRMLDFIEKARKILSGNTETDILIESLMEDQDLQFHLTRADFEALIEDELKAFVSVMKQAFELSGLKKEQIHSVELVGDATRIPKVKELAEQFFGKQSSRTLNSAQCVARGAAIQAAMLSPLFKVSDFVLHDYNPYDVTVSWSIIEQPDQKQQGSDGFKQKKLFKKGNNYPNVLALTFDKRKEKLDLAIRYSNQSDVLEGMPVQIAEYNIPNQKPKKENYSMVIKVMIDLNGIPRMQVAQMVQHYQVQNKIPMKKIPKQKKQQKKDQKKEGNQEKKDEGKEQQQQQQQQSNENKTEQTGQAQEKAEEKKDEAAPPKQQQIQYETKIVQKETRSKIKHVFNQHGMDSKLLGQCKEAEGKFLEFDTQITNLKAFKNDLEAYVYDMRAKIVQSGELANYVEEKISAEFLHHLNQTQQWLYGEGKNTTYEEYQKKSDLLRQYGDPIVDRFKQFTQLEFELAQMDQIALKSQQNIDQIDLNKEGQHITEEQKNKANELTQQLRGKMQNIHQALQGDRKLKSTVELKNAIQWKQSYQTVSIREVNKIVNKPLPPPPKKDKNDDKKDQKKADQDKSEGDKEAKPANGGNQEDIAADLD